MQPKFLDEHQDYFSRACELLRLNTWPCFFGENPPMIINQAKLYHLQTEHWVHHLGRVKTRFFCVTKIKGCNSQHADQDV